MVAYCYPSPFTPPPAHRPVGILLRLPGQLTATLPTLPPPSLSPPLRPPPALASGHRWSFLRNDGGRLRDGPRPGTDGGGGQGRARPASHMVVLGDTHGQGRRLCRLTPSRQQFDLEVFSMSTSPSALTDSMSVPTTSSPKESCWPVLFLPEPRHRHRPSRGFVPAGCCCCLCLCATRPGQTRHARVVFAKMCFLLCAAAVCTLRVRWIASPIYVFYSICFSDSTMVTVRGSRNSVTRLRCSAAALTAPGRLVLISSLYPSLDLC